jgi:hypothetical protein
VKLSPIKRFVKLTGIALAILLAGPFAMLLSGETMSADWRTASRESIGLAPVPSAAPQAIVQVYGARALSWRGIFGVHSWIAVKPADAPEWTTYELVGWRALRGGDGLVVTKGQPDRRWFGAEPELYAHLEGDKVDGVIARIVAAAEAYPYRRSYTLWPGPNSNTFTAMVARDVPELRLDLPSTAIGKDYLGGDVFGAAATSGTGVQVSLWGLLGVTAAAQEGLEINVAGLTFGVDPLGLGIKLPGIGRIGPARNPQRTLD